MALELKYRPKKLKDIVGNEDVIQQLKINFNQKKQTANKQTVLLHGPRGCGKTTLARILSERVGCSHVQEYDIASLGGIETAREISDTARGKSVFGGNKAYILDEVHKGTKHFFNALLKILEEPPNHVFFFLCTTNPEQVITTVKSRCVQYQVENLTVKECSNLLNKVISAEKASVSKEAVKTISKNCEGIPREALIMLDQIIKLPIKEQTKIAETLVTSEKEIKTLCRALLEKKKWKAIKSILAGLSKEEPETVRRTVLNYMNSVVMNSENDQAFIIIDFFKEPFYNSGRAGLSLACWESILS